LANYAPTEDAAVWADSRLLDISILLHVLAEPPDSRDPATRDEPFPSYPL
jgi:hypothetical protein